MLDDGVHRLRLLKLEEQLLHGLDGVVTAQVHGHLFNLGQETEQGAAFPARGRPREAVGGSEERDPFIVMRAPLPGAGDSHPGRWSSFSPRMRDPSVWIAIVSFHTHL